jgi:hypothetical protein
MNHLITFGQGEKFIEAAKRLLQQAYEIGTFDDLQMFTDEDLKNDPGYWNKHSAFSIANRRGYGFFLWKPYLIMKTMEKIPDGDILVYADAGCEIDPENEERIDQLRHLFEVVKMDKIIGSECNLEKKMNKMDILINMGVLGNEAILNSQQRQATAVMIFKCPETMKFVRTWYEIGCIYSNIDDSQSVYRNFPCYDEHRHDQSIFSLLSKKMNLYSRTERIETAIYILRNREGRRRKCMGIVGTQFWCHAKGYFDLNQIDLISKIVRKQKPKYVLETGFSTGRVCAGILMSCDSVQIYVNCDCDYKRNVPEGPHMRKMFHDFFSCFHSYETPSENLLTPMFLKLQYPFGIDFVILDGSSDPIVVRENLENIANQLNTEGCIIVNSVHNACSEFVKSRSGFAMESWTKDDKKMDIIRKTSNIVLNH